MSKRKDGVFSLLRQILNEQKKQTKMLETIVSSQEQNEKCVICNDSAILELENGKFICETCAQIQSELADF